MTTSELSEYPLTVLRLRGSQAEMGAQQGRLLRELGGYERAVDFYPTMAARMIAQTLPHEIRPLSEAVARALLGAGARAMHAHRARLFPDYVARTEALLRAGVHSQKLAPALLVMELLQNGIGYLGKLGIVPGSPLATAAVPACSSVCVWGPSSSDGQMRHARNFDFPGAGIWDQAPVVVFCTPDEGLRYGFVASRGADVPGVTCFNEAGLCLTVHTRFHSDVRLDGASVIDVGHDIVRRARTLDAALRIAREKPIASTWGILISSAEEKSAMVLETNGHEVVRVAPPVGASFMACTNHYFTPHLAAGEIHTSRAFGVDSRARLRSIERLVRAQANGVSARDLERVLSDLDSHDGVDLRDDTLRLAGDCVVSPLTVQSVVMEPEEARIRVSTGAAPSAFGPYITVPWSWDGAASAEVLRMPEGEPEVYGHRGQKLTREERNIVRKYVAVMRLHLEGKGPARVREGCEELARMAPTEPHFAALAGYAAMASGDLAGALPHFDRALEHEGGEYRRARVLLQKTRALAALGLAGEAERTRAELLAFRGSASLPERKAAEDERKRPLSKRRLARAVPDFLLADVAIPGVTV